MTREEHIQWCKDRAIREFDFYLNRYDGLRIAISNGLVSMATDLRKHEATNQQTLINLGIVQEQFINSRQDFIDFLNEIN